MTYVILTDEEQKIVADYNRETDQVVTHDPKNGGTEKPVNSNLKKYGLPVAGAAVFGFLGYKFIKDKMLGTLGGILIGGVIGYGLANVNLTKKQV